MKHVETCLSAAQQRSEAQGNTKARYEDHVAFLTAIAVNIRSSKHVGNVAY